MSVYHGKNLILSNSTGIDDTNPELSLTRTWSQRKIQRKIDEMSSSSSTTVLNGDNIKVDEVITHAEQEQILTVEVLNLDADQIYTLDLTNLAGSQLDLGDIKGEYEPNRFIEASTNNINIIPTESNNVLTFTTTSNYDSSTILVITVKSEITLATGKEYTVSVAPDNVFDETADTVASQKAIAQAIAQCLNDAKDYTDDAVGGLSHFDIEIVTRLPETALAKEHTFYFVSTGDTSDAANYYEEYLFVQGRFELLGTTRLDLSNYLTKDDLTKIIELDTITDHSVNLDANLFRKNCVTWLKVVGGSFAGTLAHFPFTTMPAGGASVVAFGIGNYYGVQFCYFDDKEYVRYQTNVDNTPTWSEWRDTAPVEYELPVATIDTLGGIMVGQGLTANNLGKLTLDGFTNYGEVSTEDLDHIMDRKAGGVSLYKNITYTCTTHSGEVSFIIGAEYCNGSSEAYIGGYQLRLTGYPTPRIEARKKLMNTTTWKSWQSLEVDSVLSTTSENPVQNKVINAALSEKFDSSNFKNLGTLTASQLNSVMANQGGGAAQYKEFAYFAKIVSGTEVGFVFGTEYCVSASLTYAFQLKLTSFSSETGNAPTLYYRTRNPAWNAWKKLYEMPIASASTLGSVKIGSGFTVAADGTITCPTAGFEYFKQTGGEEEYLIIKTNTRCGVVDIDLERTDNSSGFSGKIIFSRNANTDFFQRLILFSYDRFSGSIYYNGDNRNDNCVYVVRVPSYSMVNVKCHGGAVPTYEYVTNISQVADAYKAATISDIKKVAYVTT